MYQPKDYRTLRIVANISAGFGWLIVVAFFLVGLIAGISTGGFFAGLLLGIIFGFIFGIGFIVSGQMVSVFLDQKELLEEIVTRLERTRS